MVEKFGGGRKLKSRSRKKKLGRRSLSGLGIALAAQIRTLDSTQRHTANNHIFRQQTPISRHTLFEMGDAEITTSAWRLVEVGRVVLFNEGQYEGRLATIVEIIDHKRVRET